jgi:hypothetical protein
MASRDERLDALADALRALDPPPPPGPPWWQRLPPAEREQAERQLAVLAGLRVETDAVTAPERARALVQAALADASGREALVRLSELHCGLLAREHCPGAAPKPKLSPEPPPTEEPPAPEPPPAPGPELVGVDVAEEPAPPPERPRDVVVDIGPPSGLGPSP